MSFVLKSVRAFRDEKLLTDSSRIQSRIKASSAQ